jgi:hypothetical protein
MFPHLLAPMTSPSRHLVMPLRFLSVGWGGGGRAGGITRWDICGQVFLGEKQGGKFKRRFQNKGNA